MGDDPERDCVGAHAVGITPVLLDRSGWYPAAAWLCVPDLAAFTEWFFGGG